MKIDYSKLCLEDYRTSVKDDVREAIKLMAQNQRAFYDYKYRYLIDGSKYGIMATRAKEFVTVNKENAARSFEEKVLIVNNILFGNNEFAEFLNKGNFDFESLTTYIKLLCFAKNNEEAVNNNAKVSKAINEYTTKLMKYFNKVYGKLSPAYIINKINEVLVYNPELLERKDARRSR